MRFAYPANGFYGFEATLRQHARWSRPVKAVVPHGVLLNPFAVHPQLRDWPLPLFLAYSWMTVDIARACRKDVVLSASPFVYLVDAVRPVPSSDRTPTGSQKLLYFPAHSTAVYTAGEPPAHTLQRLERLRSDGFECTVSVYWRDIELGRDEMFSRRGFDVITCGHRDDPAFSDRLVRLILDHDALVGDAFGSHMFYGAYLGRPYFSLHPPWTGDGPESLLDDLRRYDPRNLVRVHEHLPRAIHDRYLEMASAFGTTEPFAEVAAQREVTGDFLGAGNLLSPTDLRDVFASAERRDVFRSRRPTDAPYSPLLARRVQNLTQWGSRTATRVRRRLPSRSAREEQGGDRHDI